MGYHDYAVPLRFLALLGHFFAALIGLKALVSRRVLRAAACSRPSGACLDCRRWQTNVLVRFPTFDRVRARAA